MTDFLAHPASGPLGGTVRVPGDKSLSHRAVLFAAAASGTSHLTGVLDSADVRSTIRAVEALGARVVRSGEADGGLSLEVTGWGEDGPTAPLQAIDCGNSGTTARLLLGLLAGWPVTATLEGDRSLSERPMNRVIDPLQAMGAHFMSRQGRLPVTSHGGALSAIVYASPVASAQVKTALLLAGLRAKGRTTVSEPAPSRDHTERLLPAFGVPAGRDRVRLSAWVDGPVVPRANDVRVPGDPSSAAFLAVAALIVPGSAIELTDVALNPTRIGFVRVLERMQGRITTHESSAEGAEPVGSIGVRHAPLQATIVEADEVPSLVDEVPVLAVAAACAHGETRFEGVGELRVKESDRLAAIVEGLRALGVEADADADTLVVRGPAAMRPASIDAIGDHRLAMTWAVAGLAADGPVRVAGFEAVDVSYPAFADDLRRVLGEGLDVPGS